MKKQRFHIVMDALDDVLLEEAKQPMRKKRNYFYWCSIAAACFLLVFVLSMNFQKTTITASELIEQGYDIYVPDSAKNVTYSLQKDSQPEVAQATFTLDGEKYTYEVIKSSQPVDSSNDESLSWRSKDLDLYMLKSDTGTSINWYSTTNKTQHKLSSSEETNSLINTAREILLLTGLDLANAPTGAENIQYNVFSYQDLIVAETTFIYNDSLCAYRMAATWEVSEDYTDISETDNQFLIVTPGSVDYCLAKISYNPNGQGKITWFDVVPGILYSLTMDANASEEALLNLANELFEPAQGDIE